MIKTEAPSKGVPSHIELWCGTCQAGFSLIGDMADGFTKFAKRTQKVPVCVRCKTLLDMTIRLYRNDDRSL